MDMLAFNQIIRLVQLSKVQATERQKQIVTQEQSIRQLKENLAKVELNSVKLNEAISKISTCVEDINYT